MNPPIRLFLDERCDFRVGRPATITWVVENVSGSAISAFSISAKPYPQNAAHMVISDYRREGRALAVGERATCRQAIRVDGRAGDYPLTIEIEGRFDNHHEFRLVSDIDPRFIVNESGSGKMGDIHIEFDESDVDGGIKEVLQGVGGYESVSIKVKKSFATAPLSLDGGLWGEANPLPKVKSRPSGVHLDAPAEEHLWPVPLSCVTRENSAIDGLYPLDIEKFVAEWPGRRDIEIAFVDERDALRGAACAVGDAFRVRVTAVRAGHLALLAFGGGGEHQVLAPHAWLPVDDFRLKPGKTRFWYGDLFPLPDRRWDENGGLAVFLDPGIERVVAILTPDQPLLVDGLKAPAAETSADDFVRLLQAVLEQRDSALAMARIDVKPAANAWLKGL